jgi:short-subunit dehydrogenase
MIVILGATSAIAKGVAASFAKRGHRLLLASRDLSELSRLQSDLSIRYNVPVETAFFDASDIRSHAEFFKGRKIEGAVLAFGTMEGSFEEIICTNYLGAVSAIEAMQQSIKKNGFIVGISSVAGDRGRQSNFLYGSAKGAFSIYLDGLRNKLYPKGIHVMTVRPGFVDTAMTFGLRGLFLVADPQDIGGKIVRALEKKKNVVYLPGFWRIIMAMIRNIPESIFKRMKL